MSIQLVTYANQTVTPTNDAIIYEKAIDQNGIFYGCNVTVTSNTVNITGGYGIVCGREFTIQSEAIAVTLAPSGTLDGRLYVRLDLADADDPIKLLTATGNSLPALEQDADVNYTNGVWEMELATFTVGVSALSDVVETFETIDGAKSRLTTITDGMVAFDDKTAPSETITANSTKTYTFDFAKTGYTVLGVKRLNWSNGGCVLGGFVFTGNSLSVTLRNTTNASASSNCRAEVAYIKDSLVASS